MFGLFVASGVGRNGSCHRKRFALTAPGCVASASMSSSSEPSYLRETFLGFGRIRARGEGARARLARQRRRDHRAAVDRALRVAELVHAAELRLGARRAADVHHVRELRRFPLKLVAELAAVGRVVRPVAVVPPLRVGLRRDVDALGDVAPALEAARVRVRLVERVLHVVLGRVDATASHPPLELHGSSPPSFVSTRERRRGGGRARGRVNGGGRGEAPRRATRRGGSRTHGVGRQYG